MDNVKDKKYPIKAVVGLVLLVFLQSCSNTRVGHLVDDFGCKGSAGYSWCQSLSECVRPWELAKTKTFGNTPRDFTNFCSELK
jgi:hypothetical protein